jgi:dipeptidyl aminopeptidase/acylaminoacyl peptidase
MNRLAVPVCGSVISFSLFVLFAQNISAQTTVTPQPGGVKGNTGPAILYNRGGTGDFSLIDDLVRVEFYLLAKEGYIVLATEYRSTGDKGRRDEWGGADVHDVLNLATVASMPCVLLPFV